MDFRHRLIPRTEPGVAVAFVYDLPLDWMEAMAWSDMEGNVAGEAQKALLRAWKVKMALIHGSWVLDDLPDF
jgi:hypothetical protein